MQTAFPHNYLKQLFSEDLDFDQLEQQVWDYQRQHNPDIKRYCDLLESPKDEIQFIPISFFKTFDLQTAGPWEAESIFTSSGTTGQIPSRHFVRDLATYHRAAVETFFQFFPKQDYKILALLPSYLERDSSSLVWMVKNWMDKFGLPGSGFYLHNFEELEKAIYEAIHVSEKILLIGVSFALLDFVESRNIHIPKDSIVIETGGMKGRREELLREELHKKLADGLGLESISSEYGMTELLSQAYATKEGRFRCPPWMKVTISDLQLSDLPIPMGQTGRINITDLLNLHSCAFISTDDLGRMHPDGSFEILGRIDHSELRGCNLLYA